MFSNDCISAQGCGSVTYDDDLDERCGCCTNSGWGQFCDAGTSVDGSKSLISTMVDVDPDEDVERRITRVVRQSIGQVLSDIVKSAMDSAAEECIQMDDEW